MLNFDVYFKNVSFWEPVAIRKAKYQDQNLYTRLFLTLGQFADHYIYTGFTYRTLSGNLFGRGANWSLKSFETKDIRSTKIKIISYVVTFGILPFVALLFKIQYKRFLNHAWEISAKEERSEGYLMTIYYPQSSDFYRNPYTPQNSNPYQTNGYTYPSETPSYS